MVPRAGLEPARTCVQRILSPLRLPISPPGHFQLNFGGGGRNRTDVHGVAVRCVTTPPLLENILRKHTGLRRGTSFTVIFTVLSHYLAGNDPKVLRP